MTDLLPLRTVYQDILASGNPSSELQKHCYGGLSQEEKTQLGERDVETYEGKVRQCLYLGDKLQMTHTDRLTAFDKLIAQIPYKGQILADITDFWFTRLGADLPSHYIRRTHPRVVETKRLEPVKAEVIVRGYLAGSMMRAYGRGEREFCGVTLPEGLEDYGPLETAIITPTSKAEAFEHDEDRSPEQLIAEGVCTRDEWATISRMALEIFALGQKVYAENGWILVDTKYEFGRDADGKIYVMDEIHTPDSSRLWITETYEERLKKGEVPEMLDKEIVRRELMSKGYSGEGAVPVVSTESLIDLAQVYLKVAEALRGEQVYVDGNGSKVAVGSLF